MKKLIMFLSIFIVLAVLIASFSIAEEISPSPEVQAEAARRGINTEGLTNFQVKNLISSQIMNEWRVRATNYKIDITGMSNEEIIYAVTLQDYIEIAKTKPGIKEIDIDSLKASLPTTGSRTDTVIQSLIINPEVLSEATRLGIDCTGLTNIQIKDKMSEKVFAENRQKALNYNLDITGLSDIQICQKVRQYEDNVVNVKKPVYTDVPPPVNVPDQGNTEKIQESTAETQKPSKEAGVTSAPANSTSTMGEIEAAGNMSKDYEDAIITAKALGIDYKNLTYQQLLSQISEKKAK